MERKIYNVVRPREDKDGKTFWDRHGVMIVKDGKISLHLASIPTNNWDGWFHVYAREEQEQQQEQSRNNGQARRDNGNGNGNGHTRPTPSPSFDNFDDDIPF